MRPKTKITGFIYSHTGIWRYLGQMFSPEVNLDAFESHFWRKWGYPDHHPNNIKELWLERVRL